MAFKIQNWLNDCSVCDLYNDQVEDACLRQELKSETGASRRISKIEKGSISRTNQEMDQLVAHHIYGSFIDMFAFSRKSGRTGVFEDVGYVFHE